MRRESWTKIGQLDGTEIYRRVFLKARPTLRNYYFQVSRTGMHSGRSASFEKKEQLPTLDLHLSDSSELETNSCCSFLIGQEVLSSSHVHPSSDVP